MILLWRTNLLARLLALVVVATLPALAVLILQQHLLSVQEHRNLAAAATERALLLDADMRTVVEGARQLSLGIAGLYAANPSPRRCREQLAQLAARLPAYAFLEVLDGDLRVACSSDPGTPERAAVDDATTEAATRSRALGRFTVGGYGAVHGAQPDFLAFALPIAAGTSETPDPAAATAEGEWPPPGNAAPHAPGTGDAALAGAPDQSQARDRPREIIVTGLRLDWLKRHVASVAEPPGATLVVADRAGTVLVREPADGGWTGHKLPVAGLARLAGDHVETTATTSTTGTALLLGYVPLAAATAGLYVSVGLPIATVIAEIDRLVLLGTLLVMVGFLGSAACALLFGQYFVRRPVGQLLQAAQAWGSGNLKARAGLSEGPRTEFGRLAAELNRMAVALSRKGEEVRLLTETLESRVADRTAALLETNNRLQVEVSTRERSEADLRQAQKLQAVGELAGGLAHQFNNLLTTVLGSLDLLRGRPGALDPRSRRLVDIAAQAGRRGERLTAQLITFSTRQRLLPTPTDLNGVIAGLIGLLSSTLGARILIETRLEPALWPALVDLNQLEVAILNLALNARDAMNGGGTLTLTTANRSYTEADASAVAPGDYVMLQVADTGVGMTPEVAARAFEPFFTTKHVGEGTGLGLSQVHGLTRQSGGDAVISATSCGGVVVTLVLPRAARIETPTGRSGSLRPVGAGALRGCLLLVDDEEAVRLVTAELLTDSGYDVLTAASGAAALHIVEREGDRIELVLADYAMPGMTGLELMAKLRLLRPELELLLVTGYAEFGDGGLGDVTPDRIMRKPYRAAELITRVESFLHVRV